ncbi:hypothetical protein MY11210_008495 [Beauveria gryllotalpidicola]
MLAIDVNSASANLSVCAVTPYYDHPYA